MHRRVASKRCAGELAAAVGDHFVDVHVELGAAARHPNMQRKHVLVLAGQDFVASLNDQLVALVVKPLAVVVRDCRGFLQGGVGRDHFARNQVLPDAEMLKRPLGLSAPELVGGHFYDAEGVSVFSLSAHGSLSFALRGAAVKFSPTISLSKPCRPVQISFITTSLLPRVSLKYGS